MKSKSIYFKICCIAGTVLIVLAVYVGVYILIRKMGTYRLDTVLGSGKVIWFNYSGNTPDSEYPLSEGAAAFLYAMKMSGFNKNEVSISWEQLFQKSNNGKNSGSFQNLAIYETAPVWTKIFVPMEMFEMRIKGYNIASVNSSSKKEIDNLIKSFRPSDP